jgi:hypothetical protein
LGCVDLVHVEDVLSVNSGEGGGGCVVQCDQQNYGRGGVESWKCFNSGGYDDTPASGASATQRVKNWGLLVSAMGAAKTRN